jgi:hypothetical protein
MKDWKLIAAASRWNIPEADLERIAPVLDALEASFRPLVRSIPPDIEPAPTFSCPPEENA